MRLVSFRVEVCFTLLYIIILSGSLVLFLLFIIFRPVEGEFSGAESLRARVTFE